MRKRAAYPEARKQQMTEAWKQKVRDALAERGRLTDGREGGVTWLAKAAGVTHGSVVKALSVDRQQQTSSIVPAVCRVLGIDPPLVDGEAEPPPDPDEQSLIEKFRRLSAMERGKLLGYASALEVSPEKGDAK